MAASRKFTRRGLLAGLAVAGAGRAVARQAAPKPLSREEELKAATERRLAAAQTLAKLDLPMATEPAFVFRP